MKTLLFALVSSSFVLDSTDGFTLPHIAQGVQPAYRSTALSEKKKKKSNSTPPPKGFAPKDGKAEITVTKTYDDSESIDSDSDSDDAVRGFFERRDGFRPLFQSLLSASVGSEFYSPPLPLAADLLSFDSTVDAPSSLDESIWESGEGTDTPWKKRPALPTDEAEMAVVGGFLDAVQQALVEIPVNEGSEEDENDMHFIEEGRRCLVMSRFQVLGADSGTAAVDDDKDELFAACWSEIACLMQEDQKDTGSLIALPEAYGGENMGSLRKFAEQDLRRPLDWLGLGDMFEVASMQRGSPAIRLIHKLSDIPEPQTGPEEDDVDDNGDDDKGEEEKE